MKTDTITPVAHFLLKKLINWNTLVLSFTFEMHTENVL